LDEGYVDPVSGTLIVGSFHTLLASSRVELNFDPETGRLKSKSSRLVDLDVAQTGEDPEVLKLLRPYQERVQKVMGQKIGELADDFDEPTLGAFINEVMQAAAGADVAVQNAGGIRTELRKGPVTMADAYRVMPFDNTLVTVELTGSQIVELLRQTPLYVSGVQARWLTREANLREVEVEMNGRPLDPGRIFKVATNNYLAFGASDILTAGAKKTDTGLGIRDLMIKEIESRSPIQRPTAESITRLPSSSRH
jgi:2',3'-cyclic-nucleotide 2'-phosphodiesterase (5'-nucleotidase family)